MRWSDLVESMETLGVGGAASAEVTSITYDSRQAGAGSVFVAMQGLTTDGNRFVRAALQQGIAALVTDSRESFAFADACGVPVALVAHGRRALAQAAAALYGHPERELKLTAVTGTNGKTTTAWLLEQLLHAAGRTALLVGTVETHLCGQVLPSVHTTPESSDLLQLYREARACNTQEAVAEVSSHALHQERVWGLPVDVAVFTNLTQDHLDYHGTMEAYAAAKARLFAGVGTPPPRVAVVNVDDPWHTQMVEATAAASQVMRYGLSAKAQWRATNLQYFANGTRLVLHAGWLQLPLESPLVGRVNVMNLLAAMAAAAARGVDYEQITAAVPRLQPAPGRFQSIPNRLGVAVVVDYAHTEDALRNLLKLGRELVADKRVLVVFGCGGDRDRTKRPRMGAAAEELADVVIVTSDNPRTEDPQLIADEIVSGMRFAPVVQLDRALAIDAALDLAQPGDLVLIAGKGHERVQIDRDGVHAFDDVAVAQAALRARESVG